MLVLLIPLILGGVFTIFRVIYNWKSYVVLFRKLGSRLEAIALFLLLLASVRQILLVAMPEESYFMITKTPIDSPAFMVRNKFREYVALRELNEPAFREMLHARLSALGDSSNANAIAKIYSRHTNLEKEFISLERLSHDLRSNELRKQYLQFGQEAIRCETCDPKNSWNYALLVAPGILANYFITLAVIFFASLSVRKYKWRFVSIIVCTIFIAYEAYELGFSDSIRITARESLSEQIYQTKLEQLAYGRNLVLAALLLLTFVFDLQATENGNLLTTTQKSYQALERSLAKLQTLRLAKSAIATDGALKKHFETHSKTSPSLLSGSAALFNGPEYKKLQSALARKYNMDKMVDDASTAIKVILNDYLNEK